MTAMAELAAMAALSSLGCSGIDGVEPKPVDDNPLGDDCADGKPPDEPDLMGWKATQRASLGTHRRKGVVAVRYEARGCDVELEVLLDCIGEGSYAFAPWVANESKLARDVAELRAKLPIGALEIGGHLKAGSQGERLATEGDAEGCAAAQRAGEESHLCSVPLRVGLLPLGTPIDCPEGEYLQDATKTCRPCDKNILAPGCP